MPRHDQPVARGVARVSRTVLDGFSPAAFAAARDNAGLSVLDLARRVGIGFATIYAWERGDRRPQLPALRKAAAALDASLDSLIIVPPDERKLSYYRNIRGITRSECAALVKMPTSTLAAIETGQYTTISEEAVAKLSAALDISAGEVVAAFERARRQGPSAPG